ncbi:hypothetical protein EYF80_013954 [Liparis tanakae]|uniref:Uncharacterized protein n=1 Tax=Liparis tanakae TaxID=230148 RepID=A0A4Z2ID37_9TELE|nr:hypothetical protein EYF80_013954 [Liparis tanakae]
MRKCVCMDTHATAIPVKSAHLNDRMPVGDRFPGTREHFTPVASTQAVCIVANSTHSDDFIMADAVPAQEGESEKKNHVITQLTDMFQK